MPRGQCYKTFCPYFGDPLVFVPDKLFQPSLTNTVLLGTKKCFITFDTSETESNGEETLLHLYFSYIVWAGNTKGGSITVPLTSCLTGLESAV